MGTAHVAVGLRRMIEGFIIAPKPSGFFNDLTLWAATASDSIYGAINLVGDSVVIYRCYVVWNSNFFVIIFPIIMLAASVGTGIYAVAGLNYIPRGSEAATFTSRISNYARANFILSLALNVLCTGLVAYRIWSSARRVSILGSRHTGVYYGALAVVVESAALYTVSLAIYIGLYLGELHAESILFDINAQIMCIVPTLILVRVALGLHYHSGWDTSSTSSVETMPTHRQSGSMDSSQTIVIAPIKIRSEKETFTSVV